MTVVDQKRDSEALCMSPDQHLINHLPPDVPTMLLVCSTRWPKSCGANIPIFCVAETGFGPQSFTGESRHEYV
jgi:hypothetical protein